MNGMDIGPAAALCVAAAGCLLMVGMLTGIWKYAQMARSADAQAHPYVDICHRTALLYSFAALVLAALAQLSAWPETLNFWAAAITLFYFVSAIATYALHGLLQDTDNQLRRPHRLGKGTVPGVLIHGLMFGLIVGEVGGLAVLLSGALKTLYG